MSILTTHKNLVSAVFNDLQSAQEVVRDLHRAGVPGGEIVVLADEASHSTRTLAEVQGPFLEQEDSPVEDGAEVGAAVGGVGGFLAGFATITLPGVGPLLILGTALITAIAGMSIGALAGGTIGLLIQLGFKKDIATQIEERLASGQVLVAAQAETVEKNTLRDIMLRHHPNEIMNKEPFATASTRL
jgi:hypothetical protein